MSETPEKKSNYSRVFEAVRGREHKGGGDEGATTEPFVIRHVDHLANYCLKNKC